MAPVGNAYATGSACCGCPTEAEAMNDLRDDLPENCSFTIERT